MGRKLTGQEWAELVNRAQKGEETGFEELYRSSYDYLYAVCIKSNVSEEDIPDVLQEAYIKVFKNIGSLADPEKFLGWAAMVVKNTGRDRGRQRKTYYERNEFMEGISTDDNVGLDTLAVDEMDPEYNPGVAMDRAATVQIVRDMIAELPDTQRDCIILWCEGLNMKDISDEVGIPVGSVKSSISYAKQKIRKMTIRIEQEQRLSGARVGDYSETAKDLVEKRLRYREKALFYKGYFPDTFSLCTAEEFAFVSIDADLYAPTAAALPLFWERLSSGGVLLVHDVNSLQYTGAGKAVREFCRKEGILPMPVCDLHGSVVLRKEWKI